MEADTASAVCRARPGSLPMTSITFAAVTCEADDPCSINNAYDPESSLTMSAYGLRALGPHTADIQAHPRATTFPPEGSVNAVAQLFSTGHPLPANTFSVPTITDGYARARWPQRLFTLLLRRLTVQ